MDKVGVDTSFITQWVNDWNGSVSSELLEKVRGAYGAWSHEREPHHVIDDNDDLMRANNVIILGPTKDFRYRKVHKIFAENKTRGRLFGYSIDLSLPPFSRLSPLELGSFIGKEGLENSEDFGHEESITNKDHLWSLLHHDEHPFIFLIEALQKAGLNLPSDGRCDDYSSSDHNHRSDLLGKLREHVKETDTRHTVKAFKAFIRGLDRTAYTIMRSAELDNGGTGSGSHLSINAYEWLCGCNESHDPNESRERVPLRASTGDALRNRQDVGRIWGGLLEYIINQKKIKEIESNEPRIQVLTKCFGHWTSLAYDFEAGNESQEYTPTTPEFIRWLRGRKWEEFHGRSKFLYERLYGSFTISAALPEQWRPRDAYDWRIFDGSKSAIQGVADLLDRDISEVVLSLAHIFNRKSDYPDRALKKADTVQDAFIANFKGNHKLGNLSDFLSAVPAQVILPSLVQEAQLRGYPVPHPDNIGEWTTTNPINAQNSYSYVTAHLARGMFEGMSVNDLIKFSNRWHQRLNRIQTRSMKLEGQYEWLPLFDDTLNMQGLDVDMQCLTSTGELLYAGKMLDNCVGGYTFKCIYGSSHIIQLENSSTLEQALLEVQDVETKKDSGKFRIEQLQLESPSNKEAPPWAIEASNELIARINNQKKSNQVSDLASLNAKRKKLRDDIGIDVLTLKAGFDPTDIEYADNAYHVLHHEIRGMFPQETREEYLAARGIASQIPVWLAKQQQWHCS